MSTPPKTDGSCGVCTHKVKNEDNGLQCDGCRMWYHIRCDKVEKKLYKVHMEHEDLIWLCRKCKPQLSNWVNKIQILEEQNEKLGEGERIRR